MVGAATRAMTPVAIETKIIAKLKTAMGLMLLIAQESESTKPRNGNRKKVVSPIFSLMTTPRSMRPVSSPGRQP